MRRKLKKIPRQLHGDGARAPGAPAFGQVAQGGREHAWEVDAPVFFEVLIFNGRDGIVENLGALLIGHQDAPLQREAADHLTIVGVNFGDYVRAIRFQSANFRQIARINE